MAGRLGTQGLDAAFRTLVIEQHEQEARPRLERWWRYYRNALEPALSQPAAPAGDEVHQRRHRQAQEVGLPARVTGIRSTRGLDDRTLPRREVVIENDIAWRVQAMVDLMFGKPVKIHSLAADEATRELIEHLLDAVWEASGGIALLQDMALLGHVYGHVDLVVRLDEVGLEIAGASLRGRRPTVEELRAIAGLIRIEAIEPTRGIAVLDEDDYRHMIAFAIHAERELNAVEREPRGVLGLGRKTTRRRGTRTEWFEPGRRTVELDGRVVLEEERRLLGDELGVVHIQNIAQPFRHEGLGEVEPLVPLQDELNTRLSDRASRVTMQSFKMYLARGIEGFEKVAVGPGQVWSTDNPDASIEAFGGDADSPSERRHIEEIREALDKVSGIPPIASGVVRARIGNLSSANALRVTLMGVLAKTARKRVTYGQGMARVCELVLRALDAAGVLATAEGERGVRLSWPDPLPTDQRDEIAAAKGKLELGVASERVLGELGYDGNDAGIE